MTRFSFLFCLILTNLQAENPTVWLRTLQLVEGEIPETFVMVEGKSQPVQLTWSTAQPSRQLNVVYDGKLFILNGSESSEGKQEAAASIPVALPESAQEILLLAMTGPEGVEYLAFEDCVGGAKFNDWLSINLSDREVVFTASEKKDSVRIPPGTSTIFRPEIEKGTGASVAAEFDREGESQIFYSAYWPVFAGQKSIAIFYTYGERVRVRRIGDPLLGRE